MTPIHTINHTPPQDIRLQFRSVQQVQLSERTQQVTSNALQQPLPVPLENDLVNQLFREQAQELTDIARSISILARQSLELDQDVEARQNLQTFVDEDISQLRTLFNSLSQDDLTLFATIFQNFIPGGLFDSGTTSNSDNNTFSDLSFREISDIDFESILDLEVLSEFGALGTLNFTNSIIDVFSGNTNGNFLESFLDDLSNSIIFTAISEPLTQDSDSESEEVSTSSDSETSETSDADESAIPIPTPISPDENPPTIIELAG
ncbi:MAG: hypothetical protein ABR534_13150 [Desulfotignum sp.]|nr:hypothetical protein [Desulfobacteraceae bacterium]